jgi:hypothetical protein
MSNIVGRNHEILRYIQRLTGAKEFAGISGNEKLIPPTIGLMKHRHGIGNMAIQPQPGLTQGLLLQLQLRQKFPGLKSKILQ